MSSLSATKLDKLENKMIISKEKKFTALTAGNKKDAFLLGALYAKFGRAYLTTINPSLVVFGDNQTKVANMGAIEKALGLNFTELGIS